MLASTDYIPRSREPLDATVCKLLFGPLRVGGGLVFFFRKHFTSGQMAWTGVARQSIFFFNSFIWLISERNANSSPLEHLPEQSSYTAPA